jgi:hypothetical protein
MIGCFRGRKLLSFQKSRTMTETKYDWIRTLNLRSLVQNLPIKTWSVACDSLSDDIPERFFSIRLLNESIRFWCLSFIHLTESRFLLSVLFVQYFCKLNTKVLQSFSFTLNSAVHWTSGLTSAEMSWSSVRLHYPGLDCFRFIFLALLKWFVIPAFLTANYLNTRHLSPIQNFLDWRSLHFINCGFHVILFLVLLKWFVNLTLPTTNHLPPWRVNSIQHSVDWRSLHCRQRIIFDSHSCFRWTDFGIVLCQLLCTCNRHCWSIFAAAHQWIDSIGGIAGDCWWSAVESALQCGIVREGEIKCDWMIDGWVQ